MYVCVCVLKNYSLCTITGFQQVAVGIGKGKSALFWAATIGEPSANRIGKLTIFSYDVMCNLSLCSQK